MGKAPKRLTILVTDPTLMNLEVEVKKGVRVRPLRVLEEKGHEIDVAQGGKMFNPLEYDLVLGPNCWRMDATLLKYVDMAVKAAREVKYGGSKRAGVDGTGGSKAWGDEESDGQSADAETTATEV